MIENSDLNVLMDSLRQRTLQYYTEIKGPLNTTHICCLFPEHPDRNPSMSYWESENVFHCFSCGRVADIFTLAHLFEGKPNAGPDFIEENVFYLAERYGLPYSHLKRDLTPEEIKRQQYFRAMKVFSEYVVANKNLDYLNAREITEDTAKKLLIGSVKNFKDLKNFLNSSGICNEIIETIGIKPSTVNENKLILIIKDEFGRPSSFVSREMVYDKNKFLKKYEGAREIVEDKKLYSEEKKERLIALTGLEGNIIERYLRTSKYINGETTIIFDKSRMFYGWSDIQREYNPNIPLVIVEGYIDFVTAYQRGIRNIVAIGSASFTDEQISIIEVSKKIKTVAIALDFDTTGKKRTEKILDRLLKIVTTKTYKFAVYKQGFKDVDETLINNPEFKKTGDMFELQDMFEFQLHILKENANGEMDQSVVFDEFVGLISKEKQPKDRSDKARILAKILTDYDYNTIIDQINYIINGKEQDFSKDIVTKAEYLLKEIRKKPSEANKFVNIFKEQVNEIEKEYDKKSKNVFETSLDFFEEIENKKEDENLFSINFNIPWFDHLILQPGNTVVISSLANTGKSTIFQTICRKVLLANQNVHIFFATTDDPGKKVYSNLVSAFSGLPREYCGNPIYHKKYGIRSEEASAISLEMREKMYESYSKTIKNIKILIENKQLVLLDVTKRIDDWKNLASAMKEIGENQELENSYKIMILDSANKVSVDGITDENQRAAFLSENIKKMSETYGFLSFVNFELNKLKSNARLSQFSLSGSKRMFYDCDVLGFVYNPMRNLQGDTRLTWERKDDKGNRYKEPILVTIQEKTKAGNNEMNFKPYFYKLTTCNNRLEPIIVGTPEHNYYEAIWEEEFENKYTSN